MTPTAPAQTIAEPLADLRGYHLPDVVSWWPPAPGWWLLTLLLLSLALGLVWWALRRRRRRLAARLARQELQTLRANLVADRDNIAFVRGLSRLLRRFALARFPPREVAGLVGKQWLAFLDAHGGNGRFQQNPGSLLSEAPYRPAVEIPAEELAALAEDWIVHNREVRA